MSSTKFPECSVIINKSGERRKVIGVCGDARFLETVGEEKLHTPSTYSVTNLEDHGYVEEAPRWEPVENEQYSYVENDGDIIQSYWANDSLDRGRFSLGNCFKTEDEAKAARERVARALKG